MKDLPGVEGTEVTWVGVSGSWRYALPGLRAAVHEEVAAALAAGKSIVTGGALGTDYWATEMALSIDPARRIWLTRKGSSTGSVATTR